MNCRVAFITTCMACGSFICIASKAQRHQKEALCLTDAGRVGLLDIVQYIDR